jgi:asparagine synthase (glutamine-hydrolysing)
MCGINGFLKNKSEEENTSLTLLKKMNDSILHRGPDQDGFFTSVFSNYSIGMAMRRLSIIDLNSGKQPIFSIDKKIVIVFNGEIYNYLTLKEELINDGYKFETKSDTEVIVCLYQKYGVNAFSMLDGMFAFSLFDMKLNKLYIARDFFGEKPLYYTKNEDSFYWASELKSIIKVTSNKPVISNEGLNLFLKLTYIPAPFTIYEDIYKLEANNYIEFNCENFNFKIYEIQQNFGDYSRLTKKEAILLTHDLVKESVSSRSIADVSLGTFLSGGVDSSIISLCLAQQAKNKIDTFSVGFDKKSFDESDKSRAVAKLINSNHHEFIISEKDLAQNIDEILLNFDEPFADSSSLATYLVSNKTRKHATVALTGDGGDEVFGGYNKYYMGMLNDRYTHLTPKWLHNVVLKSFENIFPLREDSRGAIFKINRFLKAVNYEDNFYYNIISLGYQSYELKELLKEEFLIKAPLYYYKNKIGSKNKNLNDFRNIDKLLSLEGDMLVKVDRTSMLASLECRAPFLNKEIWNFTNQLPNEYLIKGMDKKHILKEAFKDYFPEGFLNKSKKGFGVPVGDWLRGNLKSELLSFIDKPFIESQNIFKYDVVLNLVNNHLERKIDNTFRVWTFFCFQKWYKNNYLQ